MLKKDRDEVMTDVLNKLRFNLNSPAIMDTTTGIWWNLSTNGTYYSSSGLPSINGIPAPDCARGWPPELTEYIQRMVICATIAVVESIYTEKELDVKVDGILLNNEPPSA